MLLGVIQIEGAVHAANFKVSSALGIGASLGWAKAYVGKKAETDKIEPIENVKAEVCSYGVFF